jgi:hypothetical protein
MEHPPTSVISIAVCFNSCRRLKNEYIYDNTNIKNFDMKCEDALTSTKGILLYPMSEFKISFHISFIQRVFCFSTSLLQLSFIHSEACKERVSIKYCCRLIVADAISLAQIGFQTRTLSKFFNLFLFSSSNETSPLMLFDDKVKPFNT